MGLWSRDPLSVQEQAVTDSLKALKTLRCENGCVSVDPSEVVGRPGYLQARATAGALIARRGKGDIGQFKWAVLEASDLDALAAWITGSLLVAKGAGMTLDQALEHIRKYLE